MHFPIQYKDHTRMQFTSSTKLLSSSSANNEFHSVLLEDSLKIMEIYEPSGNQTYYIKRKLHPKNVFANLNKSSSVLSMKILYADAIY